MGFDWTGSQTDTSELFRMLVDRQVLVQQARQQIEQLRQRELRALAPASWRSEAQRRYSEQLQLLEGQLSIVAWRLDAAVEATGRALSELTGAGA